MTYFAPTAAWDILAITTVHISGHTPGLWVAFLIGAIGGVLGTRWHGAVRRRQA